MSLGCTIRQSCSADSICFLIIFCRFSRLKCSTKPDEKTISYLSAELNFKISKSIISKKDNRSNLKRSFENYRAFDDESTRVTFLTLSLKPK